jgi:signal transduction histidine kinase
MDVTRNVHLRAFRLFVVVACCIVLGGCGARRENAGPAIEFTSVPPAAEGGTPKLDIIQGRADGAKLGQRIVLYARSGAWYVQPFVDQPFTTIQPDSTWKSSTHLGTQYAALLVEPNYLPPPRMDSLPNQGDGVSAVAVVDGEPVIWRKSWFQISCILALIIAILVLYQMRMRELTRQLNLRFEERLAERTRIAQELHDTLLQGFLSASMQLHVTIDNLPADSSAITPLKHVQEVMSQVIKESRNTVRGLLSDGTDSLSLEEAFSRIEQELAVAEPIDFHVIVEGRPRPLHPLIRDEVYCLGREALVNAFHHSRAGSIRVEVKYLDNRLQILVCDDGEGIEPEVLRKGREGHWGLPGMRERAERIGAHLKVRSRVSAGTRVELCVPGNTAFKTESSRPPRWYAGLYRRKEEERSAGIGRRTS